MRVRGGRGRICYRAVGVLRVGSQRGCATRKLRDTERARAQPCGSVLLEDDRRDANGRQGDPDQHASRRGEQRSVLGLQVPRVLYASEVHRADKP